MSHKHKEMIIAWAEGETIEVWDEDFNEWINCISPGWHDNSEYRIKPKDIVYTTHIFWTKTNRIASYEGFLSTDANDTHNVKFVFDREGKLKSIEKLD